jgi:large subunit ribosomal protein L20
LSRARSARITRRRHKKILKLAKGYWGGKSRLFRPANEAVMRALRYAWRDRRRRKRDFRRLWVVRIGAAARERGMTYSAFMGGLRKAGVRLNRKVLAEMAMNEPHFFARLVELARRAGSAES